MICQWLLLHHIFRTELDLRLFILPVNWELWYWLQTKSDHLGYVPIQQSQQPLIKNYTYTILRSCLIRCWPFQSRLIEVNVVTIKSSVSIFILTDQSNGVKLCRKIKPENVRFHNLAVIRSSSVMFQARV